MSYEVWNSNFTSWRWKKKDWSSNRVLSSTLMGTLVAAMLSYDADNAEMSRWREEWKLLASPQSATHWRQPQDPPELQTYSFDPSVVTRKHGHHCLGYPFWGQDAGWMGTPELTLQKQKKENQVVFQGNGLLTFHLFYCWATCLILISQIKEGRASSPHLSCEAMLKPVDFCIKRAASALRQDILYDFMRSNAHFFIVCVLRACVSASLCLHKTMILSNGLSLTAHVLVSAPQLHSTCFHAVWQHSSLKRSSIRRRYYPWIPSLHMALSLLYIQNTAAAFWLYLVLKCLLLGNVKNAEGGGSDLAWSATAS